MTTITAQQYRDQAKPTKRKYRNAPVEIDGIRFDSKAEARYYQTLKIREKAGEVYEVERQRRYALIAPNGMLMTTYVADFVFYDDLEKRTRVVDTKGFETDVFKLKRKMMRALLGIEVETVK